MFENIITSKLGGLKRREIFVEMTLRQGDGVVHRFFLEVTMACCCDLYSLKSESEYPAGRFEACHPRHLARHLCCQLDKGRSPVLIEAS